MDKAKRYSLLVHERQACTACAPELHNASQIEGGAFDSEEIGPYSQWQGNLDAKLLIVAQDFANVNGFIKHQGRPGPKVRTNIRLMELLAAAGIEITPPGASQAREAVFLTNGALCMKDTPGMSGDIPSRYYSICGKRFLRRMIELVQPEVVVTLGLKSLRAACSAYDLPAPTTMRREVGRARMLSGGVTLVPVYHPSPLVNRYRSLDQQKADWVKVSCLLAARGESCQCLRRRPAA